MSSYDAFSARHARLVILKELAKQPAVSANDLLLFKVLQSYGYFRPQPWVRQQLRFLCTIGAVSLIEAGEVLIATLKRAGQEHVEGLAPLEGVEPPSLGD